MPSADWRIYTQNNPGPGSGHSIDAWRTGMEDTQRPDWNTRTTADCFGKPRVYRQKFDGSPLRGSERKPYDSAQGIRRAVCGVATPEINRGLEWPAMSKRSASNGCPTWIRTMTRRVKVACATITPSGTGGAKEAPSPVGVKGGNQTAPTPTHTTIAQQKDPRAWRKNARAGRVGRRCDHFGLFWARFA